MVGRRRFLLLGIGGSAAAWVGGTALTVAAATPTTVPVWRLSADWGYRVPPTNRTRCRCKACRGHAANKVFDSKAGALANRSHPCCACQPYSVDLLAADSAALFAASSDGSIDLRDSDSRRRFEAAVVRSLAPVPDPPTRAMGTPPIVPAKLAADAPSSPMATATAASPSTTLPTTGADHELVLAAAGVLVVAGVAAMAAAGTARA